MCRACEQPCWRDGGEAECSYSDAEFSAALDELEAKSGVIDLMERLQNSLAASKRRAASIRTTESDARFGGGIR